MAPRGRASRAAAALALVLAVGVLHGGLLGGLLSGGRGAPVALPAVVAVAPTRALDVVAPRTVAPSRVEVDARAEAPPRDATPPPAAPAAAARAAVAPRALVGPSARAPAVSATVAAADSEPRASVRPLPAPPRDDAPMPAEPPPVYATRPPAAATLHYALRRGDVHGEAMLRWQPDAAGYELTLQATLPQGAVLEQHSQGGFDDAGLAPLRLTDRRRGRAVQAVNFSRPQGRITFSGPRWEYALVPGMQDRLSWIVQLVSIAAAGSIAPGDEVALQVVGARGATARWRFRVDTRSPAGVLHLVREPEHLYDLRLELWLDPAQGHWPTRMRQAQVPGGEVLDWVLEAGPAPSGGT